MLRSMFSAISGLKAHQAKMDVTGNNIANANTVGFKSGAAQFADMYANSVATAVGNQVGIGTKLAEVQQQFSQGTITSTNQALDVAINGVMVCRSGGVGDDRAGVDMSQREVKVEVFLHAGDADATVLTNDLTHDYVHENSAYST